MSMYAFNLLSLHSIDNNNSNGSLYLPSKLNIESCSIKKLKEIIAQTLSLQVDSFDVYCQGIQLSDEEKNFNEYQIDQEDQLVIVPKVKQTIDPNMNIPSGLPTTSELHQTSKTIEMSATPNEFHRLYWLMRTPEFWRRITQIMPELLLDSSALGLCEDSVLFCQNHNPKRLMELVQANPSLYKVLVQVIKEWTLNKSSATRDAQLLSPAAYFLNGSPHLVEPIAPRQPPINVMPRRITNEDFYNALEQTTRTSTSSTINRPSTTGSSQSARTTNRRNVISMDQLQNALQTATTAPNPQSPPSSSSSSSSTTTTTASAITTATTMNTEPGNLQELLDQMRAMGLTDETANRQALEAANWDLKTALDILLG